MKTLRRFVVVTSLAVMACAISSATPLVINCSTNGGPTELGLGASNGTITCGQFNSSLGTLNSISLTITGNVLSTSTVTITNGDNNPHTGFANTDSSYSLDPSTNLSGFTGFTTIAGPNVVTGASNYLFDVVAGSGVQSLGANPVGPSSPCVSSVCSKTFNVTGTGSDTATNFNTGTFGLYTGGGTFSLTADTLTGLGCSLTGGNSGCSQVTQANFTATVTYNYDSPFGTPEPATLFLMGSALVGVGLLRKKIGSK